MSQKYLAVSLLPFSALISANEIVSSSQTTAPADTMVVTASRFEEPISTVLAPVSILTRADLESMQAKSLVDALKTLPSIEIGQSGGRGQTASIFLRGTESNHVLVLVDGVRLPRTMMGSVDFNMLPLNSIERIEVIRGSGATIYGSDAIGGVINVITRNGIEQNRLSMGAGSQGSGHGSFGVTRQLSETLALQIGGGFEKTNGYNVLPQESASDAKHGFASKNVQARINYRPTAALEANISSRWYDNTVEYNDWGFIDQNHHFIPGDKKQGDVRAFSLGADLGYKQGAWLHQFQIELGEQQNYDFKFGTPKTESNLTSEIRQLYMSALSRYQVSNTISLTGGFDSHWEEYLKGNFISLDDIEDNPRKNIGVFALANWQWLEQGLLEASIRHDHNVQFGGNTTGQLAFGWQLSSNYRLFTSYGTAFKAPGFDVLYGFGGNTRLKPETAKNAEIGIEGETFNVSWSANLYHNQIDNMIVYSGYWPAGQNENIEQAEIRGIELLADFEVMGFYHQVILDLRDPQDKTKDEMLARRAKQVAKWRTSYTLGDLQLGTQYLYQSERLDYSGGEMLGSYSVWDLTAQYAVNPNTSMGMKLANAFDKSYETAGGYPAAARTIYFNLNLTY